LNHAKDFILAYFIFLLSIYFLNLCKTKYYTMKRVIKIQVEKKNGDGIVFNSTLALCHCFKNFSVFGIVIAFVVMV